MQVFLALLLLFNPHRPETLDSFGLVRTWCMVVALMRVNFGDAEGEEGHGKEFERVLERGAVGDRR